MTSPVNTDANTLPHIPGYTILEQLYKGSRTAVYRAAQEVQQRQVVIKVLRQAYPSFNELIQFRNQYTITKNLNIPGIVRSLNLEPYQNGYALVMEDCRSISLMQYAQQQPLALTDVLAIALQLADILHHLHACRIIHKDIKPTNILIQKESKQIKLVDFSIASLLPKETQEIHSPNVLEGTLAYLAPEQTGRMNRGIDYRTDFYSLGVTLYELLTRQLPFASNDPLELVHCHIAKTPVPPHQLNQKIFSVVSDLVLKLMAKNAEDRYQSALGLKYDLEDCLRQWQERGTIVEFELGQRDICDRFLIPEKLYGREQEVKMLLEAFERVANGTSEMMLVAGFSGIGKTAVVNEVHKPITRQKGYFIKGKFDQFNRNIPFSAFVQALRDFMGQLLSESDAQLAQWRTKIIKAVGENGQVLIEVIPELEFVIGKQPSVEELSGTAAQNRFNLLFQRFIEVFTTPEHPLVIFLDDLHWADSASLQLLKVLMEDKSYLLLLAAYRDNEVSSVHPSIITVEEIRKSGRTVNTITLAPLDFCDTNQLIADTWRCSPERSLPLTELINRQTQGNPFFITQFLKALYEEGQITFNYNQNYWECDIVQINGRSLTDDVVEFMAQQLQKLPSQTQQAIKLAACIGNQFDLDTLAIVLDKSVADAADALWKALQEGLILPQSEVYKFYLNRDQADANTDKIEMAYRFLHDRVQQAAYSLIPDNQKQTTHYHIGQLLRHRISPEAREDRIFELVNQLNYGTALITAQIERDELAQLNLLACRKARAGTAYQAVYDYAEIGLNLLGNEAWQRQYKITLQLHELAAEAAAITCNFDAMYQSINAVIEHSKTVLDQVEVYLIKIQALTNKNDFLEAIDCGQLIMGKLGINFPDCITAVELQKEIEEIKGLIGDRPIEELFNLPAMVDPEKLAMMKIASRMIPACYFAGSPLFPLLASLQVKLSLQYGNSPISPTGYADYGIFILNFQKDIAASNQFGQLAYRLASTAPDKRIRAATFVPIGFYLYHHHSHLRDTLPIFQAGYQAALEVGKLEYVGHNVHGLCVNSYWCGQTLTELETQIRAYHQMMIKFDLVTIDKYCSIFLETVLFLLNTSDHFCDRKNDHNTWVSEFLNSDDVSWKFYFYINRAILRFLLGNITLAKTDAIQAKQYIAGGSATICETVFYFYASLIALATVTDYPKELELQLKQVEENQADLQLLAQYAPMNYLHKWQLVEAEKYRILGNKLEAIEMYDLAIAGAKANGYIQEEALANELAAKFYLAWGKEKVAAGYMQEAYHSYALWGAKAKVAHLEQQYPQLLAAIFPPTQDIITSGVTIAPTLMRDVTSTSSGQNLWLDFPAVMKAAQAISQEIELEKLLATLMQIVIKNAGAHKGRFILLRDEQWLVVAGADQEQTEMLEISLEQYEEIPQSLIYSVARTQETAVFDNLSTAVQFAGDRYITTHQPKSVLCTPISRQGKLVGILYLENNLTVGAFTSDRIAVLQLLTSQAAISLENARLYQQIENHSHILEAEVERKTQALHQKAQDLEQALKKLQQTQAQLIHTEKMLSLGQLVAGIAHEINNPVNFIKNNIAPTKSYIQDLMSLLTLYQQEYPQPTPAIQAKIEEVDLDFLFEDVKKILESMRFGSDRISQIVQSLRNFSRLDEAEIKPVDIHSGIDSTLLILQHRLKGDRQYAEITIIKEYSQLPLVNCYASALNQVFMNILNNAIDALREAQKSPSTWNKKPTIIIKTFTANDQNVVISIADNGLGINNSAVKKIFDPFFTTKPVGSGTGLGLSISYSIVVEKHRGQLSCISTPGKGAEFVIMIPV